MRNGFLLLSTLIFASALSATPQDAKTTQATTNDGRHVILRSDGTWSFAQTSLAPAATKAAPPLSQFVKSAAATRKIDAVHGKFALWIDPKRWSKTKVEESKITLQSSDGKGYALIISEAISIPKGSLKEVALQNARSLDPGVQLTAEETRVVNGREVLCLQFEAKYAKIPFTYYGYYYGGSSGTVQVVTFTTQPQFASVKPEFTDLLNGLEIADSPLAEASPFEPILMNDGKIKVLYDTRKWSSPKTDKNNKITLTSVKGTGWVLLIPEVLSFPLDSFPDIALKNARNADPDAQIIFREKRRVHGQTVWCLKISATVNTLPIIYYGYYYSGPAGSVQVLTYTTESSFDGIESDFTELLNSLQVNPDSPIAASSVR